MNNAKPFYIYEENKCLYIKNINEKIDRISNNTVTYSANYDDNDFVHICSIDTRGKLIHYIYKDGRVKKRTICRVCNNIKNLKSMRLFIVEKYLNVFVIEESDLNEDTYRVSHYNFLPNNSNLNKYRFNNIIKKDDSIYKLNIDDMHNMFFDFETPSNSRSESSNHSLIFNSTERKWYPSRSLMRNSDYSTDVDYSSNIKDDIFEYCYSINYKK